MNYTQSPGCNILIGQKTSDGEGSQGAIQTKSCHRTRASERRRPLFFVRVSTARFNKKKLPPHPSLTRATIVSYTHLPQSTSSNVKYTVRDAVRRVWAIFVVLNSFAFEAGICFFIPHSTLASGFFFFIAELAIAASKELRGPLCHAFLHTILQGGGISSFIVGSAHFPWSCLPYQSLGQNAASIAASDVRVVCDDMIWPISFNFWLTVFRTICIPNFALPILRFHPTRTPSIITDDCISRGCGLWGSHHETNLAGHQNCSDEHEDKPSDGTDAARRGAT